MKDRALRVSIALEALYTTECTMKTDSSRDNVWILYEYWNKGTSIKALLSWERTLFNVKTDLMFHCLPCLRQQFSMPLMGLKQDKFFGFLSSPGLAVCARRLRCHSESLLKSGSTDAEEAHIGLGQRFDPHRALQAL